MVALSIERKRELIVFLRMLTNIIGAFGLMAALVSCGSSPGYDYTVGGTVSGMVGSGMVLQNNGGDDRIISVNGSFSFDTPLTSGTTYSITVKTQPTNPSQTCSVSNGSGTVNGGLVSNVVVNCVNGPTSVTVDPSGRFAYAANTDGTVSAYNIDSTYGTLQLLNIVTAGKYPISVMVDPLKRGFVYAVDAVEGDIWAYTIETDGKLKFLETVDAGKYPTSVTIDQSGKFVYAANMGDNTISAYAIEPIYGTLTALGTPVAAGISPTSIITVDILAGKFAYVANMSEKTIWYYSIDSSNGNLTYLGKVATGGYPSSFTVDQSGKFAYAVNETSNNISVYTINQTTGALVAGTAVAAGAYPTSIVTVLVESAAFAYVTNSGDDTVWFYSINSSNGNLTYLGKVAAGAYPASVTVDPLGKFAYVANMGGGNILVYKINSDGTLTPL